MAIAKSSPNLTALAIKPATATPLAKTAFQRYCATRSTREFIFSTVRLPTATTAPATTIKASLRTKSSVFPAGCPRWWMKRPLTVWRLLSRGAPAVRPMGEQRKPICCQARCSAVFAALPIMETANFPAGTKTC